MAILMDMFPEKVVTFMSYTSMAHGLGYMLGPPLGSLLYEAGGFFLPFETVGTIMIVEAFVLLYLSPKVNQKKKENQIRESTKSESQKKLDLLNLLQVCTAQLMITL